MLASYGHFDTRFGSMLFVADGQDNKLISLSFNGNGSSEQHLSWLRNCGYDTKPGAEDEWGLERQINEFLEGSRMEFDVPLKFIGSEFQCKVWELLMDIPYGNTRSYAQMADKVGGRSYARAVGAANRTNRICIIVPCHRVVGSSGELTGYAGGLGAKSALLELEQGTLFPEHLADRVVY